MSTKQDSALRNYPVIKGNKRTTQIRPEDVWEITSALQATLDPARVIELFQLHFNRYVSIDGLTWQHPEQRQELSFGDCGRHRCEYHLNIEREELGTIQFSRSKRFTTNEIANIENLLCGLLHPLRNALNYQLALRAAHIDKLSGAHNRMAFGELLPREIHLAHRHGAPLALMVMDLDHFKNINDTHGHAAGDDALRCFSAIVKEVIRDCDLFFRYGGEEFVLVLSNTDAQGAVMLAERIRSRVEAEQCQTQEHLIDVRVSIGVAQLQVGESGDALFHRADVALFNAKEAGRNRVCIASESPADRRVFA
jgi:diguanylate cyclase (GGDEF)-like protein